MFNALALAREGSPEADDVADQSRPGRARRRERYSVRGVSHWPRRRATMSPLCRLRLRLRRAAQPDADRVFSSR